MSPEDQKLSPFVSRHIGPSDNDITEMLADLNLDSMESLIHKVVPNSIFDDKALALPNGCTEEQALNELKTLAVKNKLKKSLIGQGYYGTNTPAVIVRNLLENPAWYTAYTPYQPEISQGRLEALFYFQTMVTELTGMDIANASLLDEGTAAAEAMTMCWKSVKKKKTCFLVSTDCHPQTIDILQTRAEPLGITIVLVDVENDIDWNEAFGILLQYPATDGTLRDYSELAKTAHSAGVQVVFAADLLALTLLKPPGEMGADIVVGNSQRFGVPLGFGGPHAAFMSTSNKLKRIMPGRLIGLSVDTAGQPAYRLALQTREQHIRREKATSNICTAQALLANIAVMYACYHGPEGLQKIAKSTHQLAAKMASGLELLGYTVATSTFFDTFKVVTAGATDALIEMTAKAGYNLRRFDDKHIGVAFDETCDDSTVQALLSCFAEIVGKELVTEVIPEESRLLSTVSGRQQFMTQPVFTQYHSETEMMRYLRRLADKDLALDRAMIPLGSCTMKLNSAAEMMPISWPEFAQIHPFAPADQFQGYQLMIEQLESWLCVCTGYDAVSLQPNAGSQGEYAGLLAIKRYYESCGESQRDICLIPGSAHGTNPASAQMCNLQVVVVNCDEQGNIDLNDLRHKLDQHADKVAAIMVTYPSTHGVFEENIVQVCDLVHTAGGQVYIDGANLNALVGLASPGRFGGDVSHLNLHKTFAIPHGGGGPGVGPVAVASHLALHLPGHRAWGSDKTLGVVSSAPWGSAGILPISWMYIRMMGAAGLKKATQVAILNANYVAKKISAHYPILYTGEAGFVAHECIVDTREFKTAGVTVDDIAKRLMDFGFHAPTMSFPVPGTLMIEPTESESKVELDRFCDAMIAIRKEIQDVVDGKISHAQSPLAHAPHTAEALLVEQWDQPYSRQQAAFPLGSSETNAKYWPPVGRVDNAHGDRNLICACPPLEDYR